jgi:GNAT superfamily N-acetyltransferase
MDREVKVELLVGRKRRKALNLEWGTFDEKPPDNPKRDKVYGAFYGSRLVGMSRVDTQPLKGWGADSSYARLKRLDPQGWIAATAVLPEYRGKGVATALRRGIQRNFDRLLTGTGPESDEAAMVRLNESTGFKRLQTRGDRTQYFWMKSTR